MLLAPRYTGVNISVYDTDTEVLTTRSAMRAVAKTSATDFTRAIDIILGSRSCLKIKNVDDLVEKADIEFSHVASKCGALVVRHEWGLYRVPPEKYLKYLSYTCQAQLNPHLAIPEDHILVANVEVIRDVKDILTATTAEEYTQLGRDIITYRDSDRETPLGDMSPGQFILGTSCASKQNGNGAVRHLVDLDTDFR